VSVSFHLPEPPSANRWWRRAGTRIHLSPEARAYKQQAAILARNARVPKVAGPVRIEIIWTRSRKSGDLDKRLGVVLDALQGVCYTNDAQITHLIAERRDGGEPGLHVTVRAA
jgi:Holliday junction resolvase RusA-like endonuclease